MLKEYRHRRILLFVAIIIFLIIVFMIYSSSKKSLPKYVADDTETTNDINNIDSVITTPFESSDFSILVPKESKKVIDDKKIYYLGDLNIKITEDAYYTQINNISVESFTSGLNGNYEIFSCTYPTTSSFLIVYSLSTENSNTINVAYYIWDREKVYFVAYEMDNSLYDTYIEYIGKSIDEIKWTKNKPIENGVVMNYWQNGNFNFAYPYKWNLTMGENIIKYTNADDNMMMTIEVYQNKTFFDDLSDLEYTQYLSTNKSYFTLSRLSKDKNNILSESSYSENNKKIYVYQKIFANGTYQYYITFYIYESALTDEVLSMINNVYSYFSVN